jgi:hypothetical protein
LRSGGDVSSSALSCLGLLVALAMVCATVVISAYFLGGC